MLGVGTAVVYPTFLAVPYIYIRSDCCNEDERNKVGWHYSLKSLRTRLPESIQGEVTLHIKSLGRLE